MALGTKKICFGFSKVSKQNSLVKQPSTTEKEKIQYVECLDGKTIICKENENIAPDEKMDLVVPLIKTDDKNDGNASIPKKNVDAGEHEIKMDSSETENEKKQTLEEKAVKEILDGARNSSETKDESTSSYLVIQNARKSNQSSYESSLDDYESIPIGGFGMAMLRGMGWKPGKGTNKNGKVFSSEPPQVRPVGMGLGADKIVRTTVQKSSTNDEEELIITKGAYIKVTCGSMKGLYGQIEGFPNDPGRIIVKLAMQTSTTLVNELAIKLVTKGEYEKNCRVLNVSKYEEYSRKSESYSDRNDHIEDNLSDFEKRRHKTDNENDVDRKKRRSSRSSDDETDRSDGSDRRQHKHGRGFKNRKEDRSSEERSDDSDRRSYKKDRNSKDKDNNEQKKQRKNRNLDASKRR